MSQLQHPFILYIWQGKQGYLLGLASVREDLDSLQFAIKLGDASLKS